MICMDEQPIQLLKEKRVPLPAALGHPVRLDYEYERKGSVSAFVFTEPKRGWCRVSVREQRTAIDWAAEIKVLLEEDYKDAPKVILVCDNLNTHEVASLYKAFGAAEARRLAERLEIHYTPKHGSWLNMAEIELSVFKRQCLCRRIPDIETLKQEVEAWQKHRNEEIKPVDWQFKAEDARTRLKQLYPQV